MISIQFNCSAFCLSKNACLAKPEKPCMAMINKLVPIACFIANFEKINKAGMIRNPPPIPTKPVINPINRPAIASMFPTKKSETVMLDLGANIECTEKNLTDFACMGSALFKSLFINEKPRIALLNIGLEEYKGNDVLKKTFSILKENKMKNFEFCGYIEGNHIMEGNIDVIITDGFTGNVALKTAEGTANFISKNLKNILPLTWVQS